MGQLLWRNRFKQEEGNMKKSQIIFSQYSPAAVAQKLASRLVEW
jgi:hypothetical protein